MISKDLDPDTSNAIVKRLESRGKDPVFRSLFDTYFDHLMRHCSNVLEIGAGTGVICRALASRGFPGRLLGSDQSPTFIAAARKLASAEGFTAEQLEFKVADARCLKADVDADDFDGLIMHTLISHVDDPFAVLKAAREVARDGAYLVIVDGDYAGLSYHSIADVELSRLVSEALVTATFAQPGVVRDLPTLLSESGWGLESAHGTCVSEVGRQFSFWKTFAEAYMPRVVGSGLVEDARVAAWWNEQEGLAQTGRCWSPCTGWPALAHGRAPRAATMRCSGGAAPS